MSVESVAIQEDAVRVVLGGGLTVYDAAAIKSALDEVGLAQGRLILDLGMVEQCDTAGIQLLLQLRRHLGERLVLECYPPAVVELLELFNLAHQFGDHMVLTGH